MTATFRGNLRTSPLGASPVMATQNQETVVDLSRGLPIPGESTLSIYPTVATAPSSPMHAPDLDGIPNFAAEGVESSDVSLPVPGESTATNNFTLDTTPPWEPHPVPPNQYFENGATACGSPSAIQEGSHNLWFPSIILIWEPQPVAPNQYFENGATTCGSPSFS